jgi:hypothetical protein
MSTGLFSDEEDGYNIDEENTLNIDETKYTLKLDNPNPASTVPTEPVIDTPLEDELGGLEDMGNDEVDDKPFDDEPFDAGIEANEDEDPEKFIQQLSGKLGTSLRKYTETNGQPDFDLEKFAVNSVISATNTSKMDQEDQDDIIEKVRNSSTDGADGADESEPSEDGGGSENSEENDMGDEAEFNADDLKKELDEMMLHEDDIEEVAIRDYDEEEKQNKPNLRVYQQDPNSEKYIDENNDGENPCWSGYEMLGMKSKGGDKVPNCVKIDESEYQGKDVELNKPSRGDVKKFKVFVKNDKGNVVKVNFGDPNMEIKRDNPERKKAFRARHNCDNPGPKWKARYWSCKMWSSTPVSDLTETKVKDKISGGLAKGMSVVDLASHHGDDSLVKELKKQLEKGVKVEMEHTTSSAIAREIAMDHLYEDPKYYDNKIFKGELNEKYWESTDFLSESKIKNRIFDKIKISKMLKETVEPKIKPVVTPDVSPRRKRIWETKPEVSPKPKFETLGDDEVNLDGKEIDLESILISGQYEWDYPDYSDAFISSANYVSGDELTDEELDSLMSTYPDLVTNTIHNK